MVHDVGSSTKGSLLCDIRTEEGVVAALLAVKQSPWPRERKAELRDTIFSFRSSGGADTVLRQTIEQALAELPTATQLATPANRDSNDVPNNLPVGELVKAVPDVVVAPPASGFGGSRLTPHFTVPASIAPVTPVVTTRDDAMTSIPVRVAERKIVPREIPHERNDTPAGAPVVTTPPVSATSEPVPVVASATTIAVPVVGVTNEAAKQRINEIKQSVNSQVGNAVNLLDRDNSVGREYMAALLDAMKATSSDGDVQGTMRRLETAYQSVERVLATPAAPVAEPSVPEPAASVSSSVVAAPIVPRTPVESLQSQKISVAESVPEIPIRIEPVLPVVSEVSPIEVVDSPAGVNPVAVQPNVSPVPPVIPTVAPLTRPDTSHWDSITAAEGAEAILQPLNTSTVTPVTPVSPVVTPLMTPVAQTTPLHTPADLPTAQDLKMRSGITDPLLDADVDTGLEQLLSEWSLFRKSGIFGTGPKGRQHPLYLNLSTVPMPLILSGRFEGATPEIRQSITDYMNGWRYEQGIIYQPEETFEHFLRRVIRHIIDLQSTPRR